MPVINICREDSDAWKDLREKPYINAMGPLTKISVVPLQGGMESGNTFVTFRVDAPSGETILFETSLKILRSAVDLIEAIERNGFR
jgi:hypothetical protein